MESVVQVEIWKYNSYNNDSYFTYDICESEVILRLNEYLQNLHKEGFIVISVEKPKIDFDWKDRSVEAISFITKKRTPLARVIYEG